MYIDLITYCHHRCLICLRQFLVIGVNAFTITRKPFQITPGDVMLLFCFLSHIRNANNYLIPNYCQKTPSQTIPVDDAPDLPLALKEHFLLAN